MLLLASCVILHRGDVLTLLRHLSAQLPGEEDKKIIMHQENAGTAHPHLVRSLLLLHAAILVHQPNS